MKGYTIQHSIDLLEKAVESGGGGTAASVSYSNTSSGLVATNVQSAIDEIDGSVDTLSGTVTTLSGDVTTLLNGHIFSETEHIIGKWIDNRPLYEKTINFGALPASAAKTVNHEISDLDYIVEFISAAKRPGENVSYIPIPSAHYQTIGNQEEISADSTVVNIRNGNANANAYTECYITLRYVKTAPVSNTRNKKSK